MKVTSSQVAGTATLNQRMAKAGGWKATMLMVGVFGAGLLGLVGMGPLGAGVAFGLDRMRNSHIATKKKEILTDAMRVPIAAQLGIDPNTVSIHDLEKAAQVNPMIANVINKVDREKKSADRASVVVGAVGATVGLIPGVQSVTNTAGHLLIHGGSAVAADMGTHALFDKKVLHTQDVMEHIDAKRAQGQPVTGQDVFMLRLAQNEAFQDQIKKQSGGKMFHKMNEAEQMVVMQALPDDLAAAQGDAELLNNGSDLASMIVHSPSRAAQMAQQSSWASRVGGPRQQGSFADKVRAERAAPGTQQLG